jgi:predicted ArsR family transcriptional regulator
VVREIRAKLILTGNAPRPKVGRPAALRARVQATVTHEPQTAAQIADALQANRDRLAHVLRDLERRGAVTRLVERTQSGAFLWTLREAPTQTP